MYDYGLSILEQYGLTAKTSSRTRGALLCRTDQGILIVKEFHGSEKKLKKQQELLLALSESGFHVDSFLENQEGSLISFDRDGIPYTLQRWFEGRECDTRSREDILKSVRSLAELHKAMKLEPMEDYAEKSLEDEFVRHNQELRKIRKFIRKKSPACPFEKDFLSSVEWFLDQGEKALSMLRESSYHELRQNSLDRGLVCHGDFNQHNVWMLKNTFAVTNFDHWVFDVQMADLYHFMRKILEKYSWDIPLAKEMLYAYHRERPITGEEWQNLRIRFTYPEKYWKLSNYYYTHNKAWISEKNVEKLKSLIARKELWETFTTACFSDYPF